MGRRLPAGELKQLLDRVRSALPQGRSLPENLWRRRHVALLWLLWLHAAGVALFAIVMGFGVPHGLVEGGVVAAIALVATVETRRTRNRKVLASLVALGLLTSSALIVHVSGGVIEAHFHFFVMLSVLLLYEDWFPYLLAFAYVVVHHGTVGVLSSADVYNHPAAFAHPWRWAAIHGMFVTAAGVANVVNWRLNEDVRAENRAAYERAQVSEELFRGAFDNAPIGVSLLAPDGRWLHVNSALCRITGYTRDELLEMDFQSITHPDDLEADLELVRRALSGEIATYELLKRYIHADGGVVWIQLIVSLVRDAAGNPLYFIAQVQDVTEREQLEERLRQSQKMEAVGRLAGGVAHDFNNLLTAISGYSELALLQVGDENGSVRPELEEIRNAADRATSLTRQLLAFSRKQILQPNVLDLNKIVGDIEKMLGRLIGEDVALVTKLDREVGPIVADAGHLEQVILNLAVNSRDAMPEGGTLTIETATVELDEAYCGEHGQVEPGRYAMLAVSDTGFGMDTETLEHIFEPFFTTKEPGKGTGLGLATVYGIVKQSGGHVWVYSEPGHGTTFKIYLPERDESDEACQARAAAARPSGGLEKILLVEDEDLVRNLARRMLEEHEYTVLTASGGEEALRLCREHDGPIHLMVTDVVMPQIGGRELAERVSRLRPELRVLYTSGYTDDAIVHHGVLSAGVEFLPKPFTMAGLLGKVREILDAPQHAGPRSDDRG